MRVATLTEALRRVQDELARSQRLAHVGSWRWDVARHALIEWSDEYARIHGVALSEVRALMDSQYETVIHPDDRERVACAFADFDETGESYQIGYRIVWPNGEVREIFEIGESVFSADGRLVEQVGTVQDITDEKRAEAELQSAHDALEQRIGARTAELRELNATLVAEIAERERAEAAGRERELLLRSAARISSLGYAVWDEIEQKYATVSEEYARLFGLSADEFIARFVSYELDLATVHPDDRARYRAFDAAYRADSAETQIEYRILLPDGRARHVRELIQPICAASGQHAQSIITIQDITDLKDTEEQLRQAQKMEAVGQLTGGVAHDFNNLLAVILGNLELAEGDSDKQAEAWPWIQAAIAAAERGATLTQRLLAFSRKQALYPAPIDANALVQGMLVLLRRTLGEAVEIETAGDDALWTCRADPGQLENAILNLAINARDAMPGGGKLSISAANVRIEDDYAVVQMEASPGEYVMLAVSDTGHGISRNMLDHVFEPFFTTKDVGMGSGLGLSMVYGFVKQSGGHVGIYSEEGQGTTVKLYLPRETRRPVETHNATADRALPEARSEAVLVVEDDADLRDMVRQMLATLGYAVRDADSAAAALELLASGEYFDLLLTDVVLPGGSSGRDLADAVLELRPGLPVLYMSGYTADAIQHRGEIGDGFQFLQKPFRMADIARAVRRALDADGS
jgi:PAS domain S-box-containing protein